MLWPLRAWSSASAASSLRFLLSDIGEAPSSGWGQFPLPGFSYRGLSPIVQERNIEIFLLSFIAPFFVRPVLGIEFAAGNQSVAARDLARCCYGIQFARRSRETRSHHKFRQIETPYPTGFGGKGW